MALRINISKKNDFRENEYIVYLFRRHLSTARIRLGILAWAAICVFIGITSGVLLHWNSTVTINDDLLEAPISAWDTCRDLRVRREWRNLAHSEQQDYFDAVHCLLEQPAKISNGSAFDDFAYVHKTFGSYSHKSALFLPWHRWFIYVYETALIKQCGYSGALPYWDWTLDWEDITVSPVFDPVHGFGGDGNATGEETVGDGRCVIDGPFAGLQALRYDAAYNPHCLSRGFLRGKLLEELCSNDIHPDVITTILQKPSFKDFMHDLEERPHIAIPTGIRGDWVKFTVPYGKQIGSSETFIITVY